MGATDDPAYQLYQAVMSTYGGDVGDVENTTVMGGYTAMVALATSLEGISGDITPEAVAEAFKTMPEQELPLRRRRDFQCGGSTVEAQPAVCSYQWLRTQLDGQPTSYEAVDTTDLLTR
jgi:branched-chain amino acid transport system substrate-binding protein